VEPSVSTPLSSKARRGRPVTLPAAQPPPTLSQNPVAVGDSPPLVVAGHAPPGTGALERDVDAIPIAAGPSFNVLPPDHGIRMIPGGDASGIPVHCAADTLIDVADLVPNPRNPNKHGDKQVALLAKIIRYQGWRAPIVVSNQSGFIVSGHGRYQAARLLNVELVPVNFQNFKTPADERAHLLADNRIAELAQLEDNALRTILDELKDDDFDLELTGFSGDFLDRLNKEDEEKQALSGPQSVDDLSPDLPGAHSLKPDMLFKSNAKYDIPEIRDDMLMGIPEGLQTFAGWENMKGHNGPWLYMWATDVLRGLDFHKTVVGFYCDDYRFECFWHEPDKYAAKLINAGVLGALGPNYSLWGDAPLAVKIWNSYRARSVTRYLQEAGIRVIPDVQTSGPESYDYCFAGIPKNAPAIATQIATSSKTVEHIVGLRKELKHMIDTLLPDSLLLYVANNYEPIIEGIFPSQLQVVICRNRLNLRAESIREGVRNFEKKSAAHKD
jgi:hypothetical protein